MVKSTTDFLYENLEQNHCRTDFVASVIVHASEVKFALASFKFAMPAELCGHLLA